MADADNHMELWNKLGKTDPAHVKPFKRAGGFGGTAIKPIYTEQKMTEVFGPAGKGWGMGEPSFQVVQGVNQEILVYCHVSLWWADADGTTRTVYGVGGDKIVSYIKPNEQYKRPERWENDDEAFKKAFTDAVGNAMKHIGMSADVHMGLFDDSKYVSELRDEFAGGPPVGAPPRLSSYRAKMVLNVEGMQQQIREAKTLEILANWQNFFEVEAAAWFPAKWAEPFLGLIDDRRKALTAKTNGALAEYEASAVDRMEQAQ